MAEWHELPVTVEGGLLKVGPHEVMHKAERPIMAAMARLGDVTGKDVLEIGFGLGVLSEEIRWRLPGSHTIIEAHPVIAQKAREWRAFTENVVEGYWQDILPGLMDKFDVVFHDYYLSRPDGGLEGVLPYLPKLLKPGGRFVPWSGYKDYFGREILTKMFEVFDEVRLAKVQTDPCVTWPEKQIIIPVGVKGLR